ncbi:MAG: nuclear transport factor 2 family protein [Prolixibacteraceae bacterium]|jgi:predicted SnoaL-like aldol condensation-catalyzing enzyme|nr:nuclear transport factor 2 family protein [Prolixibacteraceae bacterium]
MKKVLLSMGILLGLSSCSSDKEEVELTNKQKAVAVLESIETGNPTAITYINEKSYTQHNLAVADGLQGFGETLKQLPEGSAKVEVIRAFEEGDYVFTHTKYNFFGPKAGFDIFRFENGRIVEHWDNLSVITEPNPSGHTQFDGETKIVDLEKTKSNKALVESFVQTILVKGEMDKLASFFDGDNYIQHNSGIADGLSGLGKGLQALAEMGITMRYNTVHKVLGEGNFVLVVSEGTFGDKPTAFYDLFRVEGGKIVEHWDVLETILPKSEWKNSNGKF